MTKPMTDDRCPTCQDVWHDSRDKEIRRLRAEVERWHVIAKQKFRELPNMKEWLECQGDALLRDNAAMRERLAAHEEVIGDAYEELRLWLRGDNKHTPLAAATMLKTELTK